MQVNYADIEAAARRIEDVVRRTPVMTSRTLNQQAAAEVYVKCENFQRTGAFKVRGGVNLVSSLSEEERAAGILASSTGNHGQSLAFAAARFGTRCTIVAPARNNPDKIQAMRRLGAEVIEHGRDFDEARDYLEQELIPRGGRYVHSANEPLLIAGVGTMAEETFDDLPDPDVILVPIGLGSSICGNAIVAKSKRPETQVIGVQAVGAAAVTRTWQTGEYQTTDEIETWAEGLATRVPAELTMQIMRELVDDIILVDNDELRQATWWILKQTHNLAEGAGAATLAAAYQRREALAGKKVVGVLSGGNLDLNELPAILKVGGISC